MNLPFTCSDLTNTAGMNASPAIGGSPLRQSPSWIMSAFRTMCILLLLGLTGSGALAQRVRLMAITFIMRVFTRLQNVYLPWRPLAGLVLSGWLLAGTAQAQVFAPTSGANNPFSGVDVGITSTPSLGDLDGDGDLDAVVGENGGPLNYFKNTGTPTTPVYTQQTGADNPFNGVYVGADSAPSLGDLDGDGDLDAVVGVNNGPLSYFKNTGTPTTPVYTQQTGANNPFSGVAVGTYLRPNLGDLDGDGDLDAVVGESNGTLLYFKNTGTPTNPVYAQQTGTDNPFNGVDVGLYATPSLGDVDGDGDLDAVVGRVVGTLLYFKNTGTATNPVYTQQTGTDNPFNGVAVGQYSAPNLGDLDGDGDLDAVVGEYNGTLFYYKNNPNLSVYIAQTNVSCFGGSTGAAAVSVSGGIAPYTYSWAPKGGTASTATGLNAGTYTVTITDANNLTTTRTFTLTQPPPLTGSTVITNVACFGGSNGAINLTPSGGTAPYTFNWGDGITTEDRTGLPAGTYTVTITDANGCPATVQATLTQPLALTTTGSQTNATSAGAANGTASVTVSGGTAPYTYSWVPKGGTAATATGLSAGTYTVTITDANGCTTTRNFTIAQDNSATVAALSPVRNANAADRATNVTITLDESWAAGTEASQAVTVWSGQAGGKKAGTATVSRNSLTFNPTTDFKPGETVFATTTTASGLAQAHVYQFTTAAAPASATFSGGSEVGVGSSSQRVVAVADVDGDGDLDLLTANRSSSGTVSVRLNDGKGAFRGGSEVAVGSQPLGVAVADVDGDGDLDFLTANGNSADVSVRLNNGLGAFSGGSEVAVGLTPSSVAVADVDGDGDLDLLAANVGRNNVSVRFNDGGGNFADGSEVAVENEPRSVAAADVDGDGDLDLLVANFNGNTVSVRLNNGDGTFGGGSKVAVGSQPLGVAVADVDGDGDLDFLTANSLGNNVSVRLNNGDGTFGGGSEVGVGSRPQSVAVTDVDGDGDLDLLTANEGATVSVRLNQPVQAVDTEKPVITTNGNKNVPNDAGVCTAVVAVSASATDNASVGTPTGVRSDGQALDAPYPVGTTTITWNVTDVNGNAALPVEQTVTVTNAAPVISSVTASINPIAVNTAINLTVAYTDNNVTSAAINWSDGTAVQQVANPVNGFVTPHTYTTAGVYTVKVTLTDACKVASGEYEYQYVVVYDPNGGFVTGGGWINSPAGAYVANPNATGRANFGFVSKYQKGATVPTGKTDFEFKAVGLEFASTAYEWLVVAGAKAQYKGVGTINGSGNYGFLLSALDGQVTGGGGMDKVRIKIWDKNNRDAIVYDNQRGASDDATATTVIGGGSIVVHDGKNKARMDYSIETESSAEVSAYPNPVLDKVTIDLKGMSAAGAKTVLTDAVGKSVLVNAHKVRGESSLEIDMSGFRSGLYIIQLRTEATYTVIKVIKQ